MLLPALAAWMGVGVTYKKSWGESEHRQEVRTNKMTKSESFLESLGGVCLSNNLLLLSYYCLIKKQIIVM